MIKRAEKGVEVGMVRIWAEYEGVKRLIDCEAEKMENEES
jgi:hypothetical protein